MRAPHLPDLESLATAFEYLDDLRESGVTNMMGAGAYLVETFSYDRDEARDILSAWMRTFSTDPALERASAALAA